MSVRTLLWICWVSVVVCSVQSQDTSLVCPPFADNATVTLTLDVNNSTFSSCTLAPSTVTCSFTPRNGSPASVCSQSVEQCNQAPTALGCWCTGATGTGYTYSLNFTARQNDHEGGDFSCSFDCTIIPPGSSTPPPVSIAPSCLNIAFAAPTTAPPNTTSEPPGTTTASSESPSSPTGNSSTSGPASPTTGNSSTSSSTDSTPIATSPGTTGNVSSTPAPHSDLALYIGLGFVGLVCLVGIVVVCVLIVRRRKSRKKLATTSANDGHPDQEGKNNHAYINTTL